MGKWFGTDGIRGKVNSYPMDGPTTLAIGAALGRYFHSGHQDDQILIAQDTRISGDMLVLAVGAGICSAGMAVCLTGVLPTPGLARLVVENKAAAGVVISASHNPYEDNGIKVFDGRGYKLSEAAENQLEGLIEASLNAGCGRTGPIGRMRFANQAGQRYLEFLQRVAAQLSFKGITIVLDCANGATFQTAPQLFESMGARVVALFCEPNGTNINDHCGSQYPGTMAKAVTSHGADLGLAFDGDGDRLIAVDENGHVLSGDQIMAICARHYQQKGLLTNNTVVSTVMSNTGFLQAMQRIGIQVHTTQVGDRYVMQKMIDENAVLGGEDSGHIIFRDVHTTGDGLVAALRLLEALRSDGRPLSELAKIMTVFPQELINVEVRSKPELKDVPEIMMVIDQVEKTLGLHGRVLVRYSGTQNMCRVMVEGPSEEQTAFFCRKIAQVIRQAIG